MFENFAAAKTQKRPLWATSLIAVSLFAHVAFGGGLIIRSFWVIDKLTPPETSLEFAVAAAAPPPPAGSSKPKTEKKTIKKVKELVQIDPDKKPEAPDQSSDSEDEGVEGGVEGGVAGGVVGGVVGGEIGGVVDDKPPPPPPAAEPQIVPQAAIQNQFISGERDIQPPNDVYVAMERSGKGSTGVFKMCLNAGGTVQNIKMLKTTGYPAYDNKIRSAMNAWKYRPFMVNGKAVPVCTSVTFIFKPNNK